jgi:MHS family proline/betaine transporter-like MFS transporter
VLAILSEQAPDDKRGLVTSLGTFFSGFGVFLGTLLVFIFVKIFTPAEMLDYGWRLCFVIGLVLACIVLVLQFIQDESPEYIKAKEAGTLSDAPVISAVKEYPYQIFIVFALAGYLGIVYYMVAGFVPTFLEKTLGYHADKAMLITMVSALFYFVTAPLWGMLSDKIGRKKVLLPSCAMIGLLIYPAFAIITTTGTSVVVVTLCLVVLMLFISAATATFVVTINELFPTHLRFSGVATGYNLSNALLGGTVPLVSGLLVAYYGNIAPSIYAVIASIIIVIIIAKMPETKGINLEK